MHGGIYVLIPLHHIYEKGVLLTGRLFQDVVCLIGLIGLIRRLNPRIRRRCLQPLG